MSDPLKSLDDAIAIFKLMADPEAATAWLEDARAVVSEIKKYQEVKEESDIAADAARDALYQLQGHRQAFLQLQKEKQAEADQWIGTVNAKEAALAAREVAVSMREKSQETRSQELDATSLDLAKRADDLDRRESEVLAKEADMLVKVAKLKELLPDA